MRLLSGESLREAVLRVSRSNNPSLAVAFWGRGAGDLIGDPKGRTIRLICNLRMGGTNPDVIADLMQLGIAVQQSDRLHAKVYIGDTHAVVTSANASINGLGLEGNELAGWIETGVELTAQETLPWFEQQWKDSNPVSQQDLKFARSVYRERAQMKPTRSFAEFSPTKDDFPLVGWVVERQWSYNDNEIRNALGYVNDAVHEQIDNGLDVEGPEDISLFRRGRWVLCWWLKSDGMPDQRSKPWWVCSSGIHVPKAFAYRNHKPQDAILGMDPLPPKPFDTSDRRFRKAFVEVMSRPEFAPLREQSYKGSFYAPRGEHTWQFWVELKRCYNELSRS